MKLGASTDGSDDYRNGANTYGWVVEIDPFTPTSTPKKRTALGRFGARGRLARRRWRPASRSSSTWATTRATSTSTSSSRRQLGIRPTPTRGLAAGDKYLDDGKLYVAKFNADGTGSWLELRFGVNGITGANAGLRLRRPGRRAGQHAPRRRCRRRHQDGSTRVGRGQSAQRRGLPDAHQQQRHAALGSPRPTRPIRASTTTRRHDGHRAARQPQRPHHPLAPRRRRSGGDHLHAGTSSCSARASHRATPANVNLSGLTADNDFSSPDGCGSASHAACCGSRPTTAPTPTSPTACCSRRCPGQVGDGAPKTITNTDRSGATKDVHDLRRRPARRAKLRRFLVGPQRLRDHRHRRDARRQRRCSSTSSIPGETTARGEHQQPAQLLAGRWDQPPALVHARDHQERWGRHRAVARLQRRPPVPEAGGRRAFQPPVQGGRRGKSASQPPVQGGRRGPPREKRAADTVSALVEECGDVLLGEAFGEASARAEDALRPAPACAAAARGSSPPPCRG